MRTILMLMITLSSTAWADQNHECQGGFNCGAGGDPSTTNVPVDVNVDIPIDVNAPVDVTVPLDVTVPVDVQVPVDVSSPVSVVNQQGVNIENQRQAPGIGLSTPSGSTGVGVTTPWGGLMVNLPWSWGDRKVIPICDRLWFNGETIQAERCICLTSVMKKLHDTREDCETSLGGGSFEPPKTEIVYETVTGPSQLVAQIDEKRVYELEKELALTKAEVSGLRSEVRRRTQAYEHAQQEVEQVEAVKQEELNKFLKSLENRKSDG